jgi:hypothetical protein
MDLATFRKKKDDFFRQPDSPLTLDQRPGFSGLKYWPENSALRLELPLDTKVDHDLAMMQTSTGGQKRYVRAGKIKFTVGDQAAELFVYKDEHGYFLPFRDGTCQDISYGAGRYLEPEEVSPGQVLVDFNLAYNPYCAYNESFSCPIPPLENWIEVRIEAGEKKFKD